MEWILLRHLLRPFFQDNSGKPAPEGKTFYCTGARDDGVAVVSAGPYANHFTLLQTDNHASTPWISLGNPRYLEVK